LNKLLDEEYSVKMWLNNDNDDDVQFQAKSIVAWINFERGLDFLNVKLKLIGSYNLWKVYIDGTGLDIMGW